MPLAGTQPFLHDDWHMMNKPVVLVSLVAACGVGWVIYAASQPADAGKAASSLTSALSPSVVGSLAASSAPAASVLSGATAGVNAVSAVSATPIGATASGQIDSATALRLQINSLGLSRELSGVHSVSYDDRSRTVLGTKETKNSQGSQTVLVIRDDSSGQIDYWQPALQFVLKPGNSYEAFIKERPAMQRRFVNIEQAQVAVDAANIAAEHAALKADTRVASVNFMPVVVRPTAK